MAEALLGLSGDGSVILDIGEDVGALVLHTTPEMFGREIDLLPDDDVLPTRTVQCVNVSW